MLCPVDHRCVCQRMDMFFILGQIVEGCAIAESSRLADRCIHSLAAITAIGLKGRCVKGHQGCSAGLGAAYPLDTGMQQFYGLFLLTCYQAGSQFCFACLHPGIISVPGPSNLRLILHILPLEFKD